MLILSYGAVILLVSVFLVADEFVCHITSSSPQEKRGQKHLPAETRSETDRVSLEGCANHPSVREILAAFRRQRMQIVIFENLYTLTSFAPPLRQTNLRSTQSAAALEENLMRSRNFGNHKRTLPPLSPSLNFIPLTRRRSEKSFRKKLRTMKELLVPFPFGYPVGSSFRTIISYTA